MAAVRCYENRPPQSGFGDDFDAVGDDNSFHFARNFWLVAGRSIVLQVLLIPTIS
jgi:hypothetical protein